MRVAVDSSVLVALVNPTDCWHAQAVTLEEALTNAGIGLVYFDCVMAETITVLARRLRGKGRQEDLSRSLHRLESHTPFERVTWILPDVPDLYDDIVSMVHSSAGALSFNDALIALSCQRRAIQALASFDTDFDQVAWLTRYRRPADIAEAS